MINRTIFLAVVFVSALTACVSGTAIGADPSSAARPEHWAQPVAVDGAPNLYRITPTLYRSAQPTAEGMKNLEKLGIRTVINLRAFNSDDDEACGTALRLQHSKMLTWRITDAQVTEVMRTLKKPENGPFLIHCNHGFDRTDLLSAIYRILEQHWSAEGALAELTNRGHGFPKIWSNIPRYLRKVNALELRGRINALTRRDGTASTHAAERTTPAVRTTQSLRR